MKMEAFRNIDALPNVRVGFDLVEISQIDYSLAHFGIGFTNRLFTNGEIEYAQSGEGLRAERLAARFAAKEAFIKAFNLGEAGISWREVEVIKGRGGSCELRLHGRAATLASEAGNFHFALSLSHDGGYAGAVVVAMTGAPKIEKSIGISTTGVHGESS